MGRKGGELTEVGSSSSSIALLQERFRKLEKMREKREERELLRLFSGPEKTITQAKEPVRLSTQPKDVLHSRPTLQDSLSLGLDSYSRHAEYQSTKGPTLTDFWATDATTVSRSRVHDSPEVDTSLHL